MNAKHRTLAILLVVLLAAVGIVLAVTLSASDNQSLQTDGPTAEPTAEAAVDPTAEAAANPTAEPTDETVSGESNQDLSLLAVVNGVEVPADDAYADFEYYAMIYFYYGYSAEDINELKYDIANYYVELELIRQQFDALGLAETLDMDQIKEEAAATYEEAAIGYKVYVDDDDMTEEEVLEAARAMLHEDGYDLEYFEQYYYDQARILAVMEYYQDEVEVSDDDIRAYYDELVAQDKQLVEEDPGYYEIMTGYGERVMYVPEGLRAVKHILVLLSEEDENRMYELESELEEITISLEGEDADTEALNARKAEIEQEMDEIYATIEPTIEEIMDKLEAGEDFIDLMEQYGEDPGMTYEPYKTDGYYVYADSAQWVISFRDAAMALEKPGDISQPVRSSYGLHIIRYENDVPSGPVAYESVCDDLKEEVSETAFDEYFAALLGEWISEAEIELYMDCLNAAYESVVAQISAAY